MKTSNYNRFLDICKEYNLIIFPIPSYGYGAKTPSPYYFRDTNMLEYCKAKDIILSAGDAISNGSRIYLCYRQQYTDKTFNTLYNKCMELEKEIKELSIKSKLESINTDFT